MIELSVFLLSPSPEGWKLGPAYAETSGVEALAAKAWTLWLLFIGVQVTVYFSE